jgi:biopolymer transport protein TolR
MRGGRGRKFKSEINVVPYIDVMLVLLIIFMVVLDMGAVLDSARRAMRAEHPEYPVMIAGDRDSKYDDVIQLISEAKKMGINRVGLATK